MPGRIKRAVLAAMAANRAERDARWAKQIEAESRRFPLIGAYRHTHFILEDREIVPAPFEEWANWFEHGKRIIEQTHVGDRFVSTVFLGIDHNFMGMGGPILFETMIFDGPNARSHDLFQERSRTYREAVARHAYAVALVESGASLDFAGEA
jgi:hypothetical protein